jgi:hypothetical protein
MKFLVKGLTKFCSKVIASVLHWNIQPESAQVQVFNNICTCDEQTGLKCVVLTEEIVLERILFTFFDE